MIREPFAYPHDHELAGLRDYRATRRPRRSSSLFWIALAFLLGTLFGAQLHGGQDGGESPNGHPRGSVGTTVPTPVGTSEACLRLQVRPTVMLPMTRSNIRVELRIPRHAHHRRYAIAWTSDVGSEGSTQRQLEGEASAVLQPLLLRDQPAGHYQFVAAVYDDLGKLIGRETSEIRTPIEGNHP